MDKQKIGLVFCLIASILYCTRYITAAIFISGVQTWSSEVFNDSLQYVGKPLLVLSIISFIIGLVFLLLGIKHKQ